MKSVYGRAEDFPKLADDIHDPYALAHQIGFFLYELYTTEKSHWNNLLKDAEKINDPEQVAFFTGQETSSSIIRPGAVDKERLERGTIAVMLRNKLQSKLADFRLDPFLEEPVLHPPEETAPRSFGTTAPHSPVIRCKNGASVNRGPVSYNSSPGTYRSPFLGSAGGGTAVFLNGVGQVTGQHVGRG